MIIKIVEKCQHENGEGLRTTFYEVEGVETLLEAFKESEENFDSDNIIESDDDFEEACEDSEIISVEIAEGY